jgi:hypothetical protein
MAKKTHVPDHGRVAGGVRQLERKSILPEDRQRMRESALKHRPRQYATGPRTPEGKAKVAENGRYAQKNAVSRRTLWPAVAYLYLLPALQQPYPA